jgi:ketosteroid isomerase-like protein
MSSEQTATSLEQHARRIFEVIDAMDIRAMAAMITDDAQGVDEISRAWIRGRAALEHYFGQIEGAVDEVHSRVHDVHVTEWGDAGTVTCVLEQTYRAQGREHRITAPTSLTFRREGGEWKIAVFHSVPLPDQPAG